MRPRIANPDHIPSSILHPSWTGVGIVVHLQKTVFATVPKNQSYWHGQSSQAEFFKYDNSFSDRYLGNASKTGLKDPFTDQQCLPDHPTDRIDNFVNMRTRGKIDSDE